MSEITPEALNFLKDLEGNRKTSQNLVEQLEIKMQEVSQILVNQNQEILNLRETIQLISLSDPQFKKIQSILDLEVQDGIILDTSNELHLYFENLFLIEQRKFVLVFFGQCEPFPKGNGEWKVADAKGEEILERLNDKLKHTGLNIETLGNVKKMMTDYDKARVECLYKK